MNKDKKKHAEYLRQWRGSRPEKEKAKRRALRYGLTEEQYEVLRAQQSNRCAICQKPGTPERELCIDHDHETGRVRGLLCDKCNRGIGQLDDDPLRVEAALAYLRNGPHWDR